MLVQILFFIIFAWIGYKWYKLLLTKRRLSWITAVPGYPIIGNILEFGDTTEILDDLMRLINKYGKIIFLDIATRPKIIATDYDFIEFVLSTQKVLDKSTDYKLFHNWLGTGLLTSDGPKWKKRRRLTTPAFHFSILEQFVDTFESNGCILINKLEKMLDEDYIDMYRYMTLYALDVVCETAMGVSVGAQKHEDSEYVKNVKRMCKILVERALSGAKANDILYPLFKDFYTEKNAIKHIHSLTYSVIDSRRKKLIEAQANGNKEHNDDNLGRKKKMAFLDILLQSTIDGEPLSREDIREEVDTFMFEGHDTTSSAMSFAVYLLAGHPEVQQQALEEQKAIFGDDIMRQATYNDLQEMKYLEFVIKETLRLFPSVPSYGRITNQDTVYKGHTIPKGVNISIFAFGIMRDPDNYPDPNKFDPSRFDRSDGKRPYALIPFSAGPRNCIGQKFAMLEIKSILSKLLRNFELLPTVPEHKLVLAFEVVLKSKNGTRIRLAKRKW